MFELEGGKLTNDELRRVRVALQSEIERLRALPNRLDLTEDSIQQAAMAGVWPV
jgi:hypothetical protein